MLKNKIILFITLLFCFSLVACEKLTEEESLKEIRILLSSEASSYDPNFSNETFSAVVLNHMYEGLVKVNSEGDLVPAAAESYDVSEQYTKFTFHLKNNLKWSDGKNVTAHDYVDSWFRIINPTEAIDTATLITPYVKNVQAYIDGEVNVEDVGIKALDDYTLEVITQVPTPFLVDILSSSVFYPVRLDMIENSGGGWDKRPRDVITNGAYILVDYEENEYMTLEKNIHYHDESSIKLDRITFVFRKKNDDVAELYNSGQIDGVYQISESDLARILDTKLKSESTILPSTVFISINHDRKIMKNDAFREALSIVLDRDQLVKDYLHGAGIPSQFLVPLIYNIDGSPYRDYVELDSIPKTEKAQEILTSLRKSGVYQDESINLLYNNNGESDAVIDFLKKTYKEALGIEIRAIGMKWPDLYETAQSGDYDMVLMGWTGDYPHPMTFLSIFDEDSFYSEITRWDDATYKAKLKEFLLLDNETKVLKALHDIEKIILEGNHIIPLYYRKSTSVISSKVKGWYKYSTNLYLQGVWLDDEN